MSSTNSTVPPSNNDTSTNDRSNSTGTATYYGAAVIIIFILIALAIAFRILYTRKFRRRDASDEDVNPEVRDQEERLAMERRGEEAGLPTYRESILLPNGDTILAATPMSSHPFPRSTTPETLPNRDATLTLPVLPTIADESVQPPKYEEDRSVDRSSLQVQHLENSDRPNVEMRMSSNSNTTLVLTSINVQQAQDQQPNRSRASISEPPSFDPSSSRTSSSTSNAAS